MTGVKILLKVVVTAIALWASTVLPGISLGDDSVPVRVATLLVVAVIFGVINAVLKPIIKTVGCGFYVLTLGLIALVVNGLLFWLTGWVAEALDLPFHVDGFWPAAVLGALLVGVVSWILNMFVPDGDD